MTALFSILGFSVCYGSSGTFASVGREHPMKPNAQSMGASIGALLRESNEAVSMDVIHMNNGATMNGLRRQLDEDSSALVNPEASQIVSYANEMMAAKIPNDGICARSWQSPCPDGWLLLGTMCRAPATYSGSCKRLQDFEAADVSVRVKFSEECVAPWPCSDDSCPQGREYDHCPRGWGAKDSGLCERQEPANRDYKCNSRYAFGDMTTPQKQELARVCGLEWECLATCDKDYTAMCPEAWASVGEFCFAPALYEGDCRFSLNTTESFASVLQKKNFETKCAAPFPCKPLRTSVTRRGHASALRGVDGSIGHGGRVVSTPA